MAYLLNYKNVIRDLRQFGFVGFNPSGASRVIANSMPKAGTNLLSRALFLHP